MTFEQRSSVLRQRILEPLAQKQARASLATALDDAEAAALHGDAKLEKARESLTASQQKLADHEVRVQKKHGLSSSSFEGDGRRNGHCFPWKRMKRGHPLGSRTWALMQSHLPPHATLRPQMKVMSEIRCAAPSPSSTRGCTISVVRDGAGTPCPSPTVQPYRKANPLPDLLPLRLKCAVHS